MSNIGIVEFVKNPPYDIHLHSVAEAAEVLYRWKKDIPERIPEEITPELFFAAHIIHMAGFDHIDPYDSYINHDIECSRYGMGYDAYNDVEFDNNGSHTILRVKGDGIFETHEEHGKCNSKSWTDFERVQRRKRVRK